MFFQKFSFAFKLTWLYKNKVTDVALQKRRRLSLLLSVHLPLKSSLLGFLSPTCDISVEYLLLPVMKDDAIGPFSLTLI